MSDAVRTNGHRAPAAPTPQKVTSARRLLVISERLPRSDESGGARRFAAILAVLASRYRVDLWVERDETRGRTALPLVRIAEDRARIAAAGVSLLAPTWRALNDALVHQSYDAAVFEFHQMAARYARVVRDRQPRAAIIVDSVDVHFARLTAGASIGVESPRSARRTRHAELAVYRTADAVIVTSELDAKMLLDEARIPTVYCVRDAVVARPRSNLARSQSAIFIGHFHHAPNRDAMEWFVRDIWPDVRRRHQEARLTIIGTYVPAEIRSFASRPGVDVLGYVPDTTPYLDSAAVAIAPLRYGAGLKAKVTEAMAAGVPVVTTSYGAQGLGITSGEHLLIADDAQAFASSISGVFSDPERSYSLGIAGQTHITEVCSPTRFAATLHQVIEDTVARKQSVLTISSSSATGLLFPRVRRWRVACWHTTMTAARKYVSRRGRLALP